MLPLPPLATFCSLISFLPLLSVTSSHGQPTRLRSRRKLLDGEDNPKFDEKAGKPLHGDWGMKMDPETHTVTHVNGEPIDLDKQYTILMGCRLCTLKSSNVVLAKYVQDHPENVTDSDVGGPPQPLIKSYLLSVLEAVD